MKKPSEKKVWFITGTSTGIGREIAENALESGYKVVATARKPEVLIDNGIQNHLDKISKEITDRREKSLATGYKTATA